MLDTPTIAWRLSSRRASATSSVPPLSVSVPPTTPPEVTVSVPPVTVKGSPRSSVSAPPVATPALSVTVPLYDRTAVGGNGSVGVAIWVTAQVPVRSATEIGP